MPPIWLDYAILQFWPFTFTNPEIIPTKIDLSESTDNGDHGKDLDLDFKVLLFQSIKIHNQKIRVLCLRVCLNLRPRFEDIILQGCGSHSIVFLFKMPDFRVVIENWVEIWGD